jgi:hypothetical protein
MRSRRAKGAATAVTVPILVVMLSIIIKRESHRGSGGTNMIIWSSCCPSTASSAEKSARVNNLKMEGHLSWFLSKETEVLGESGRQCYGRTAWSFVWCGLVVIGTLSGFPPQIEGYGNSVKGQPFSVLTACKSDFSDWEKSKEILRCV